jgi:hypothetical protein
MELKDAKLIIKNALDLANQKGCYSLDDIAIIIEAYKKIESVDDIQFGDIIQSITK